jgi:hypothetical protein
VVPEEMGVVVVMVVVVVVRAVRAEKVVLEETVMSEKNVDD